jgi:hypothetical protein
MTGAELVIKLLTEHGVESIFGYPGGAIMPIYDALYQSPVKHYLCRHEQGGAFSAIGFARASGKTGVCMATSGPGATNLITSLADALLAAIGEVAWVDQEDQINPVTAVSGGGPAYVFLLAEVLEAAAVEQGLPRDLARRMSRAPVAGSGALLGESEQVAAHFCSAETSP